MAGWAAKVAVVLDSLFRYEAVGRAAKRAIADTWLPPPTWVVAAAAMSPTDDSTRVRGLTLCRNEEGTDTIAYIGTFRVVHVVVQVLCPLVDDVVFARTEGWEARVVQLWPGRRRLHWPPPAATWLTSEAEFNALASAFVAAPRPA